MTEFHTRKRIDNSRLARPVAPERLRELLRLVSMGVLIAAVALLYAWQHFACIQMRYQLETLKAEKAQTLELNQNLKLEQAGLLAPARIDEIARQQLGLTVPAPGQVTSYENPPEAAVAEIGSPGAGAQ